MAMKAKDLPIKETAMQGFGQAVSTGLKYMDHNRIQEWVDAQTDLPTDPTARREAIMKQFPIYMRWRAWGSAVGLLVAGVVMDNENRLVIRIGIVGAEEKTKPERRRYDLAKYCVECVIRNWGPLMCVWGIFFEMLMQV